MRLIRLPKARPLLSDKKMCGPGWPIGYAVLVLISTFIRWDLLTVTFIVSFTQFTVVARD